MKESIYTIPINDAFDSGCDCPLCFIYNQLENELVEQAVGAGMMEPDHRANSDEKGLCKKHAESCNAQQKVLPLALVLHTYTVKQNKNIKQIINNTIKSGLFKSKLKENAKQLAQYINNQQDSCYICEKLENTVERYTENVIYMWNKMPEFKEKFNAKPHFCLKHYADLLSTGVKELNNSQFNEFYNVLTNGLVEVTNNCENNVFELTKAFDYRFDGEVSAEAKTAIPSIISKYFFK